MTARLHDLLAILLGLTLGLGGIAFAHGEEAEVLHAVLATPRAESTEWSDPRQRPASAGPNRTPHSPRVAAPAACVSAVYSPSSVRLHVVNCRWRE